MKQKIQSEIRLLTRRHPHYTAALIYSVILIICFFPLFNGTASLNWDAFDLWLPWKHFIVDELYTGQLPLWNPYFRDGFPQHGDTMTWYPISWVFGFLFGGYNLLSLHLEFLVHLLIAGTGMFSLSRRFSQNQKVNFLIGLSFMLSGFMIGNAQHVAWVISAAWMPWYFLALLQLKNTSGIKEWLFFVLVGYFLFSGGYLALFFVTVYLTLFYFIWLYWNNQHKRLFWRLLMNIILGALVIALLSLPLLVSAYEVFPLFNRFDPERLQVGKGIHLGSTPWNGVLSLLFPLGSGVYNVPEFEFGTFTTFFGLIPFLLLLVKFKIVYVHRTFLLLFTIAVLSLMCSMGDVFPIRKIISYFPLLDLFRYPTLFRLFYIFISLILLSMVLEKSPLKKSTPTKNTVKWLFGIFGLIFIMTAIFIFQNHQNWEVLIAYFKNIKYLNPLQGLNFNQRLGINFLMLGITFLGLCFWWVKRRHLPFYRFIYIAWFIEVVLVAGTSAPQTVYHSTNVNWVNHVIQSQPKKPNQLIPTHGIQENNKWKDYVGFSWKSKTFYTKQFSSLWYNPLHIKTPETSTINVTLDPSDALPFIGVVKTDSLGKHSVNEDKNIQFEVISNQHWRVSAPINLSEKGRLFIKQRYIPDWEAFSSQQNSEIQQTQEGYMLVDLSNIEQNTLEYVYNGGKYKIAFWISAACLLILLLVCYFLSSHKMEWSALTLVLVIIALIYNQQRFYSSHNATLTQENSIDSGDFFNGNFYLTDYWKSKSDTVYIPQNLPKTDQDIAYISLHYPKKKKKPVCINEEEFVMQTKDNALKPIVEIAEETGSPHFNYDLYNLVRDQRLYRNVIFIQLNYKAAPNNDLRLWLAHKRNGEWVNGDAWPLSVKSSSNNEKQLIAAMVVSAYDLVPDDELKLFVWGEADSTFSWSDFSIYKMPF
jgi:hypothetical protein